VREALFINGTLAVVGQAIVGWHWMRTPPDGDAG
jgi:hypothetical protein